MNQLRHYLTQLDEMMRSNQKTLDKQTRLKESLIRLRAEKEIEDRDPVNGYTLKPITHMLLKEAISNGSSV